MHPVLQNIFISFMHPVAVSDAAASGEAVAVAPPAVTAEPSHAEQLQHLADLIAANNASCEDDVPLFLRRARA